MIENRVQSGAETKRSFIEKWDENKLKNLKIEEYSSEGGNNRKDFTYDLEHNTPNIGSIRGGDSSKFKIYKYNTLPKKKYIKNDETYAWYGNENDRSSAFENVKKEILKIVNFAKNKQFEEIEKLNFFGNGIKWKIAFLYAPEGTLVDIFSLKALRELSDKKTIYEIQRELISNKPLEENIYEYSFNLWSQTSLKNKNKNEDAIEEKVDLMNLTKEHILKAIDEFDLDSNMCKGRDAKNWDLIYNGEKYPHKCIVGRAYNISQNLEGILDSDLYGSICEQNHCASKILKELGFELKEKTNQTTVTEGKDKMKKQPLNQILYGSPGTGKTYHTIDKALEIIFENEDDRKKEFDFKIKDEKGKVQEPTKKTYNDILKLEKVEKRKHLKGLFEYFKDEQIGQIGFVTFHQSYGYEEFVEGIKAETKDKDISYEIKAGIFKSLVEKSLSKGELVSSNEKISEKNVIWKMSLGDSQSGEDKEYFDEAIKTNCLIMGYGDDIDFTSFSKKENFEDKNIDKTTIDMIDRFKNQMNKGDIVIISDGNRKFKAIAIVEGDYFYDAESIYKQKRKIKWLQRFTISRDVKEISEKNFTQVTLNKPQWINLDKLNLLISNDKQADNTTKNYVLIIDEINRGNISKIFGELITLIEDSKRLGKDEQVEITLPYSGQKFGVPSNLYIIGTMNTADRSIAPIDTALRRRFVFEEMAPNPDLLKSITVKENEEDKIIELDKLLEAINTRIEYLYDRDHTIGHAYLIDVKNLDDLRFAFKNKIIPLLAEYFYEDWENIDLVLNSNGFIKTKEDNNKYLAVVNKKISGKKIYEVSNDEQNWNPKNFEKIYDDKVDLTKKAEDTKINEVDIESKNG